MAGALMRLAIERLVEKATALGVPIPAEVSAMMCGDPTVGGALLWANAHPDADLFCCEGAVMKGPEFCTCWTPVFEVEQEPPQLPSGPEGIRVADERCFDCAFRKGSPERQDEFMWEALQEVARAAKPFWCHQGMRRPVKWVHPDGMEIAGDPADWQPAIVAGVAFQADGSVALLCAGWAGEVRRAERQAAVDLAEAG